MYTNTTGVPLSVAVYLATDNYDYDPECISTTTLIGPLRQTILSARITKEQSVTDVLQVVKSRTGTAIHDSIERAWKNNYKFAMQQLGYPEDVIARIVINPDKEYVLKEEDIPVYLENRSYRNINGIKLSGKYDFVAEGRVEDFKSTTVFTWIKGSKDTDHQLQGSIYRWLNPTIILEDNMAIQYFFTDWFPGRAAAEPKYPNRPVETKIISLLSLDDTEEYINTRIDTLRALWDSPQEDIPLCTDDELWRSDPEVKYYKNPASRKRSTKNFNDSPYHEQNLADANARFTADGGVGVVVVVPGTVMKCKYCKALPICEQAAALVANGSLKI